MKLSEQFQIVERNRKGQVKTITKIIDYTDAWFSGLFWGIIAGGVMFGLVVYALLIAGVGA